MSRFLAGTLVTLLGGAGGAMWSTSQQSEQLAAQCAKKPASTFSPDEFKPFKLLSSRYESQDTRRFFFALESAEESFNMPVASCIVAKFTDADGKDVVRPYTPISSNSTRGHFELLVKKYPKGKMGNYLFAMQPGEELLIKGPFEKFAYKPNMWKHVGMIAGGTGISPMYQVIRCILENPKDRTNISLIYANNQRRDILLANELMEMQKTYNNFNMYLTLLDVPHRWLGGIGYVNEAMISAFMPKPGEKNTKILVCGPPPMLQAISGDKLFEAGKPPQQGAVEGLLKSLGYKEDQVFKY
ncbi:putative Nadh-cytochrome b5 reductase [Leptomonas seymouri]|uniref:NADH-cytochrome b5 reductase n=1 Tax=Leptomonas seymouri TaxID=5684 RepID=A0A0N1PBS9_LEPSE|nr:putative Nadh-cytochrome b5 reductase [Leptomonas seymouri]|eukprot:KPI85835.1 putative Nadh-cytochrome b5 reductase [Leptomonas seymouri]